MKSILATIVKYLETFEKSAKLEQHQVDRVALCKTILTNISMEIAQK